MSSYEIDFLPIEKTSGEGNKSGDAIVVRFLDPRGTRRIVVIDAGYKHSGERVVEHIKKYYETSKVDLVISTHPDADHINGIPTVLTELDVAELFIHRPHNHTSGVAEYSNIEVIDAVIGLAEERDIAVVEPFTGISRFDGAITILGPTEKYYEKLLAECLTGVGGSKSALGASISKVRELALSRKAIDLLDRILTHLPIETLGEDGFTGPRNRSSAITLLTVGGERLLFTGDAGIESLERASKVYEETVGEFYDAPLEFFQAPHHGSRRNLSPSLLNRLLGKPGDTFGTKTAFISSAAADPDHPSPKVTNALKRRDLRVYATEGTGLLHSDGVMRPGWSAAPEIPPLEEDSD